MGVFEICVLSCVCSIVFVIFSNREKEFLNIVSLFLYVVIMIFVVVKINEFFNVIKDSFISGFDFLYSDTLFKIFGIAFLGSVASSICAQSGQKNLSVSIDIIIILEILGLSVPIIKELAEKAIGFIGE